MGAHLSDSYGTGKSVPICPRAVAIISGKTRSSVAAQQIVSLIIRDVDVGLETVESDARYSINTIAKWFPRGVLGCSGAVRSLGVKKLGPCQQRQQCKPAVKRMGVSPWCNEGEQIRGCA